MNFEDDKVEVMPNKTPRGVSKETFDRVVSAAETLYLSSRGQLPTIDELSARTTINKQRIVKIVASNEFKSRLLARGITWSHNPRIVDQVTPEQAAVISVIMDPTLKMDLRAKLKRAGITYATYRNWLRNPAFAKVVNGYAERSLEAHLPDFHTKIIERGLSGDLNAIKFVYELTGRHDPAKQQMVDFSRMVALLLEVITRNVTDPNILRRINNEVELVLSGESLKALDTLPANLETIEGIVLDQAAPPTINGAKVPDFLLDSIPENFFDRET